MTLRRLSSTLVLAALLVVAAGCGGGSGSGGGGSSGGAAGIVPGDAVAFVTIDTDTSSTALKNAQAVLDKFPFHTKAIASFEKSLNSAGPKAKQLIASVGPELDVAVIKVNGKPVPVGFTKPSDVAAFTSSLNGAKSEQISGWTVFTTTQAALDAVQNRTSNLSDDPQYKDAVKSLPGDPLVTAFAGKAAFSLAAPLANRAGAGKIDVPAGTLANVSKLNWITADATSHDDGVEIDVHTSSTTPLALGSTSDSLSGEIPGGVLAAAAFNGSSSLSKLSTSALKQPGTSTALAQVQKALGVSVQDLVQAVNGPSILYLKAGAPLPEVTFVVKPADAQQAQATVGTLLGKATKGAKPTPVTVNGVTLQSVSLGPISILYGVLNGQLVLTDSQTAVGELQSKSNRLADDDTFKAAKKASGLPDSAPAWLYVDLKDTIPAAETLATLAGQKVPPAATSNLGPLESFVAFGSADGSISTATFFLQTN